MRFRDVAWGAIAIVLEYRARLISLLFIPFVVLVITEFALEYFENALIVVPSLVMNAMAYILIAITTHRVVLLGLDSVSKKSVLSWSKRETSFFLYMLIISFGTFTFLGLVSVLLLNDVGLDISGILSLILILFLVVVVFWFVGRYSLIFPAIAVDKSISFSQSWKLTHDHHFMMLFVVLIFPICVSFPITLIEVVPGAFFIASIISTVMTVFMVAALSVAYKKITYADKDSDESIGSDF